MKKEHASKRPLPPQSEQQAPLRTRDLSGRFVVSKHHLSPTLAVGTILDMGATAVLQRIYSSRVVYEYVTRGAHESVMHDWGAVAKDFQTAAVRPTRENLPNSKVPHRMDKV